MKAPAQSRVVVAMSGGVDSSVAAALLKDRGYDVIGVSLKLRGGELASGGTCCSIADIADARLVCDALGIPFYAFDYEAEFRRRVMDVFAGEYARARTPNPCILCNRELKFGLLMEEASKLGADYLATGHHARVLTLPDGSRRLGRGKDPEKDQSYVLFELRPEDLRRVLFPVGDYTKTEVRALARGFGLKTHDKRESMDICFIPDNDHGAFIKGRYPHLVRGPGDFVDGTGSVLGRHGGIERYTIGQRRGLGLGFGRRMYVSALRPESNEVVLGDDSAVRSAGALASGFRCLRPLGDGALGAKIRAQRDEWPCEVVSHDPAAARAEVRFLKPARAVTPGQAIVLYDGDEVVAGGWIEAAL